MRKVVLAFATGLVLFGPLSAAQTPRDLDDIQSTFRSIAERAGPSCVNISAYHEEEVAATPDFYFMDPEEFFYEFFQGPPRRPGGSYKRRYAGTGSGVIIDPQGYVLTNAHVVSEAQEIRIRMTVKGSKKTYPGRVVGKDERLDLALIKIEGRGPFLAAALANSDEIHVGDWAIAIGSPFELEQTFTVGVISALRQSLPIDKRVYQNMIQTDAAINRGNSGGPLLNIKGEVVGINTAIFSPSGVFAGVGFAIPINAAKEVLPSLRAGKERQWGWLGVSAAEIDDVVKKTFALSADRGALINDIFRGSPAEKTGLRRGDAIVAVDGQSIATPQDLTEKIRRAEVGQKIKIDYLRGKTAGQVFVIIGARPRWADMAGEPKEEPAAPSQEDLRPRSEREASVLWHGIEVIDLRHPKAAAMFRRYRIMSDDEGVLIVSLAQGGPLAGYLQEGDVIVGINQKTVRGLADFKRESHGAQLESGVVFDILRQGNKMFVSVQADPTESTEQRSR
ncbi:MAG: trypsin-like peptidase domain-containing protein [Elusimicrobia bacterium]|nr:trypsin-like peptidase domain-containing protein [Elusimicrobiota bacterium]